MAPNPITVQPPAKRPVAPETGHVNSTPSSVEARLLAVRHAREAAALQVAEHKSAPAPAKTPVVTASIGQATASAGPNPAPAQKPVSKPVPAPSPVQSPTVRTPVVPGRFTGGSTPAKFK